MQDTTEPLPTLTSPSYNPQFLLINGNKVFLPSALANQDSLPLFLTLSSATSNTLLTFFPVFPGTAIFQSFSPDLRTWLNKVDFWSLLHPGTDLLDPGGEVDCELEGAFVRTAGIVDCKLERREADV